MRLPYFVALGIFLVLYSDWLALFSLSFSRSSSSCILLLLGQRDGSHRPTRKSPYASLYSC